MMSYFEAAGWINFLRTIAETKVFDVPGLGLDSIECAKMADCYKVLMYASDKRNYNVAYSQSMKSK